MAVDTYVQIDIEQELAKIGISEKGKVTNFIANSVLMQCDRYVPFDEAGLYEYPGRLRDSGHIENNDEVVWRTPYARYLYYHPEFNFQGAPLRGGFWVDRMLQDGGLQKIQTGAQKLCRQLGGN